MYAKRVSSSHSVFGFSSFFSSGLASAGFVSSGLGAWAYTGALNATPKSTAINITPSRRVIRSSSMSDCAVAVRAGSDPDRLFERLDEHLAVTDAAGPGSIGDQPDDFVRQAIGVDDFDLHFRQEVYRVLAASVHLGVALLAAEAPDLGHGHPDDARARERFLHVIERERLDDRLDLLHIPPLTTLIVSARAPSPSRAASAWIRPWRGRASPEPGSRDSRAHPSRARRDPPSRPRG